MDIPCAALADACCPFVHSERGCLDNWESCTKPRHSRIADEEEAFQIIIGGVVLVFCWSKRRGDDVQKRSKPGERRGKERLQNDGIYFFFHHCLTGRSSKPKNVRKR